MTLARVNRDLESGESVEKIAARFKISSASLFRHRLNHLQPNFALRQVMVSEDRSAFDVVASLVDAHTDTEAARMRAAARGQTGIVLRAVAVQARIAKTLFAELGLDDVSVAERLRTADALQRAIFALIRKAPLVASSLATELRDAEPALAHEFDVIFEQATKKENAA